MIDILNIAAALLTIAFGAFGFLAPRYTMSVLDIMPGKTNMGLSEMRASVGGLFVLLGLVSLIMNMPEIYFATGIASLGAAAGRLLSVVVDNAGRKAFFYFVVEAALGGYLVLANWVV